MAIIGSAEVEVRADVRRLGRDITDSFDGLNKEANKIADDMGKTIADSLSDRLSDLEFELNVDTTDAINKLSDVDSLLESMSDRTIRVDIEANSDGVNAQLRETEARLNTLSDQEVEITPTLRRDVIDDVERLRSDVVAAFETMDIEIEADFDMQDAEARLREAISDMESDNSLELGVTLDRSDLESMNATLEALRQYNEANDIEIGVDVHIAKAMAQIALLTRDRRMQIFPQIGGKFIAESAKIFQGLTGINVMREDFRKFIDSLTQLDERLGPLAMQLTALSAAVPTAGAIGGWAVTMIGDLATLSGLLVPLAGLLGGAAIGGGTLMLALMGTGERLDDLIPKLEKFRDTISNTYWGVAEKPLRNMISKVLPPLQDELETTATSLGKMSGALFDAVTSLATSEASAARFGTIVGNTNLAIEKLGPAFEPFLNALLIVSTVGSSVLPQLSDWAVQVAEGFEAWAIEAEKTGEMQQWMEDAIEIMQALFSIVGSTVGIMRSLYDVAKTAGFPGIVELAEGFERVNEALKESGNIEYMNNLASSVMTAMGSIADGLSWVGPLLSEHADGITETIETMGSIVGEVLAGIGEMLTETGLVEAFFGLFDSLETAVGEFEPVWEALGVVFETTLDALGAALENLAPVFAVFFQNLETDARLVKPALMDMLDVVGEWGPKIMEIVGTVTEAIFEFLGGLSPYTLLAATAFLAMLPAIGAVGGAFVAIVSAVGGFLGSIGAISGALGGPTSAAGLLSGAISRIGSMGIGPLMGRIANFIPGVGLIVGIFVSAFAASEDLRKAVGDFLVNAFKTLGAFIQPLIGPIGELFGTLMDGVSQIGSAVAPAFTGLFNALNSIMPVIQVVAFAIGTVLGGAISGISTLLQSVFRAVSTVVGGIATTIGGVFNTIASVISGTIGVIKALVSGDMAAVGEALTSLWDNVQSSIGEILGGLVQTIIGIFTGIGDIIGGIFSGLLEIILSVFDGFDISEAGSAIIQSMIDGFESAFNAVRDWLVDLTQKIIEWKGPPDNDATLLTDAGRSIIMSLVDGFTEAVQAVFEFLQTLTQQIVDLVMNIINGVVAVFQAGWQVLVTIVSTVWNAIVTVIQTVWTIITTVITTYINLVVTIFQTGWNILTTVIQAVWTSIQLVIQTAWQVIQIIIQTALTVVVTIFTTIWNTIVTVITTVWTTIQTVIRVAITTVMTIISTILNTIMGIVRTVWTTIQTVTMTVWNGIKVLIQLGLAAIRALISGNFQAFRSIITTIWNVIKSVTSSVWNSIKSAISSIINAIKSTIQSVFNAIRSTITSIMNGIRSTIQSVWNTIRSAISSAVNTIRSVVTSAFNAVRSIITSVMNAARSIISSVWSSIRSTISSAVSSVRSTVSSGFNALRGIVTSAWNAVVSAIRSAISRMMGLVRGIPGQIRSALGNLGSLLTGAGRSIIQGLINGVTGMIGSLRSKFSEITGMIPDWKGPPDTDAKLLTNAGELIMEGLIDGLESKYGKVKNSLTAFTSSLTGTVGTQLSADVGVNTSVRRTALSDAERRLSYRSALESMVQSNRSTAGTDREVHIHFHQAMVNESEIVTVVNRELGRGV